MVDVVGSCVVCGIAPLMVREDGHLSCKSPVCGRPLAVSELLTEKPEHIVQFNESDFDVKHPLWERLDDYLLRCQVMQAVRHNPLALAWGRYRVLGDGLEARQWIRIGD